MEIYETEEEQATAIKKWIKTNAPAVVIGIVLGLGALKGWDYWKLEQLKKSAQASAEYEAQLLQFETTEIAELEEQLASFKIRNESQVYNNFLQLKLAKKAVEAGQLDIAVTALNNVINNAANAALKHSAVLRLARIMVAKNTPQQAIDLLNRDAQSYKKLYAQVRGDAYFKLGEVEKARQAYLMAKGEVGNESLQMKIDNLAFVEVSSDAAAIEGGLEKTKVKTVTEEQSTAMPTPTEKASEEGQ